MPATIEKATRRLLNRPAPALIDGRQAIGTSLPAVLPPGGGVAVFWLIGCYGAGGWTAVALYLLIVHTGFVMLGIIALARAMTGKALLGR